MSRVKFFVAVIFILASDFLLYSQNNPDSLIKVYDSLGLKYSKSFDDPKAIDFFNKAMILKLNSGDSLGMINSLENLSKSYQRLKKYDKAIDFQLKALELKNKINNTEPDIYYEKVLKLKNNEKDSLNLTRLYYRYALLLDKLEKKKQSIDYFNLALSLASKLGYGKAIATISNDFAGEYWDLGEKELSTSKYEEALQASLSINDSNRIAAAYLNLGDIYKEQGEYEKGMNYLIEALEVKEAIPNTSRLCFYYIKAAEIARASYNYEKWKEYINKAYSIKDKSDYATLLEKALIYQNMGEIAEYENNIDDAFKYYDTLLIISKQSNYLNGKKVAYSNKASLYKKMAKPEKALEMLIEANKYETENPYYLISSNNSMAELYMETGDNKKALELLKENINNPVLNNYADQKHLTLKLLYQVNTKLANYKEAFRWNDSLQDFNNRLLNMKVRTNIAELETKYETEKSKNLINNLKAKNEFYNQQIRFAILLIIILIAAILLGIYVARVNKLKAKYREDKLRQQMLRLQMSPHFIFNALNSIQQLIIQNKNKEAQFYLSKFSSISRIILEYSTQESIPLDKEIELLGSYIEIEKLRASDSFDYKVEFDDNLETEFIEIPPMIIQPFVENAIKHGLKEKEEKGFLLLKFIDKGDILQVIIEDNGIGINKSKENKNRGHKSMSMKIFESRKELLQRQFKKKLNLKLVDLTIENKSGTRVIIDLPVI